MKRTILSLALAASAIAALAASEPVAGTSTIVYAEGTDLTVVRGPREISLKNPVGEKLLPGDYVQTGRGSAVEIVTLPRGSVIRVAENTTFRILGSGEGEPWGIELLYGRIRTRAEGTGSYEVRAGGSVVRAAGADFGMDIVVSRGTAGVQGSAEVYCFEGSISVSPAQEGAATPPLILGPGKAASARSEGGTVVIGASDLKQEKRDFWSMRGFQSDYAQRIDLPKSPFSVNAAPAAAAAATAAPVSAQVAVAPAAASPVQAPAAQPAAAAVVAAPVPAPPAAVQPVAPVPPGAAPAYAQATEVVEAAPAPVVAVEAVPASPAAAETATARPIDVDLARYKKQVMAKNALIGAGGLISAGGVGLQIWSAIRLREDAADLEAQDILLMGVSTSVVGVVVGVIGLVANPSASR